MVHHFSVLRDAEVKSLIPDLTLFLFPVGGLEQHGPHLPMGTKILQSREWVELLASKLQSQLPSWNFVVMPQLPFTVDPYTTTSALSVRPHVMRDAVVDQCESLIRMGFCNFATLSTHLSPKQLGALEDASKIVTRRKKAVLISLSSAMVDSRQVFRSPMIPLPDEHAGAFDTGLLMVNHPELIGAEASLLPPVDSPRATAARFFRYFTGEVDGYWGNPSGASPELSMQKLNRELDILVEKMKPVLEQRKGKSAFFSHYRWFPVNGSFFKAYLLAVLFFLSIFAWMLWGFKNVFE